MKLLIEIDEEDYKFVKEAEGCRYSKKVIDGVINGVPIPDNATNGDVIKVMFPQYTPRQCGFSIWLVDDTKGIEHAMDNARFDVDFWNAPYKADKEEA